MGPCMNSWMSRGLSLFCSVRAPAPLPTFEHGPDAFVHVPFPRDMEVGVHGQCCLKQKIVM